jgi:hypothetical protein
MSLFFLHLYMQFANKYILFYLQNKARFQTKQFMPLHPIKSTCITSSLLAQNLVTKNKQVYLCLKS